MIFTTSWDDGYALDLKIADLLERYGCKGTFYICPRKQHGQHMLSAQAMQSLSERFEIGAHSMTHPHLTKCKDEELRTELEGSKQWVEGLTQKPCTMFCYPFGEVDNRVEKMIDSVGYRGARTTEVMRFATDSPFRLPVSLQIAPFPFRKRFKPD